MAEIRTLGGIVLRNRELNGGSIPGTAKMGEPFVNLYNGVLRFSGTSGGDFEGSSQTGVFEVQIELLDAADDFYLSTGVKIEGSTNELETAGASGNQITLMCIIANQWWITGEVGTSADAGAID